LGRNFDKGGIENKGRFTWARRIAAAFGRAFKPDGDVVKDAGWKTDLKEKLFNHDREELVRALKDSPEKLLFTATLLLNEDYRISAAWALVNAAQEGADIAVAEPYLNESMCSDDKNLRCLSAKALTFHYLHLGRWDRMEKLAEASDPFVRGDVFDSVNIFATDGKKPAVAFLVVLLSHPERNIREQAFSALELAIELGGQKARDAIKEELRPLKSSSGVTNLLAIRYADKLSQAIELSEKAKTDL
jgi:hypothetical protein